MIRTCEPAHRALSNRSELEYAYGARQAIQQQLQQAQIKNSGGLILPPSFDAQCEIRGASKAVAPVCAALKIALAEIDLTILRLTVGQSNTAISELPLTVPARPTMSVHSRRRNVARREITYRSARARHGRDKGLPAASKSKSSIVSAASDFLSTMTAAAIVVFGISTAVNMTVGDLTTALQLKPHAPSAQMTARDTSYALASR